MAKNIVRRIISRILRGSTPEPTPEIPKGRVIGHRGVATGLPTDTGKWETISAEEVEAYVYKGAALPVHSSNVEHIQYDINKKVLIVSFHGGGQYSYQQVSEQEAINFAQAFSKGKFIWDTFRVRGSRTAHKKPYSKIR